MKQNLLIRADASLEIGTGHVMRCLTLAKALKVRGMECRFVCRAHQGNLVERIRQDGFAVHVLPASSTFISMDIEEPVLAHAAWLGASWQMDADQTVEALDGRHPDWVIVDHYALDARWEAKIRPFCKKIMAIDDLADREHDCDLLLDQNLVVDWERRYDGLVPSRCHRLLGVEYALLQPEYVELRPHTPPRIEPVRRILVYFGGADHHNLTHLAICAFLDLQRPDIVLDVVIHSSSSHAAALRAMVRDCDSVILHEALPSLASLMLKADLAIGAGGATSWERCCLGLPSLVITLAENQKPIAEELYRQGLVRYLGHFDAVTQVGLVSALRKVLDDGGIEEWSRRCMKYVDGKGTERVGTIVLLDSDAELIARQACVDDELLLLRWVNDPLVRKNAFQSAPISPEEHRRWFYAKLQNLDECKMYIVETVEGFPVGQVRFDFHENGWSIDYSLDVHARMRRLGAKLLQTAIKAFRNSFKGALLFGEVKAENIASQRVFDELGFVSDPGGAELSIAICSDAASWMNESIPDLLVEWLLRGYRCIWVHTADQLRGGDICFYLSYSRIVSAGIRSKYKNNLVVHESDLPQGKGWSPLSWQILEGKDSIPVTLFEADDLVDSGVIYSQKWLHFEGDELVDELRAKQAEATCDLCKWFVVNYPVSASMGRKQKGAESFYPQRRASDSELDPQKSLQDQFNLLRIVDNERYPAFLKIKRFQYFLKISRDCE